MTVPRWILVAMAVLLADGAVRAHDLGAQAKLHGGKVTVEAYYDDDTAASEAKVRVLSGDDREVRTGTLDGKGLWTFPAPPPGTYRVFVDAGGGHRVSFRLTIPEGPPPPQVTAPSKGAAPTGDGHNGAAREPEPKATISSGPPREQFTQFPWSRLLMGLTVVAGLAWLARWWLQTRPTVADGRPLA